MYLSRAVLPALLLLATPAYADMAPPVAQLSAVAPAQTPAQTKEQFVKAMIGSVLVTVHDNSKSFAEKQTALRNTFVRVVDTGWIAQFVIGQAWNSASQEQKTQYTNLYRNYLTNTYVSHLSEDSEGQLKDIKILGINDRDDDMFGVRTEMVMAQGENVKVDYLVRQDEGQYRVIDIRVEGVSLLATHRAEFSQMAASVGINGVISKLHQINKPNDSAVASLAN